MLWRKKSIALSVKNIEILTNPEISYIFNKTLVLCITCFYYKCGSNDKRIFKLEESNEILKILGLFGHKNERVIYIASNKYINLLKSNMTKENTSQEFRLKNLDETIDYFVEEID